MSDLKDILPFLIFILMFVTPIVWILAKHQQKMAEILHANQGVQNPDVESLRMEIRELKGLIHQQAISMDDLRRRGELNESVQSRIAGEPS